MTKQRFREDWVIFFHQTGELFIKPAQLELVNTNRKRNKTESSLPLFLDGLNFPLPHHFLQEYDGFG